MTVSICHRIYTWPQQMELIVSPTKFTPTCYIPSRQDSFHMKLFFSLSNVSALALPRRHRTPTYGGLYSKSELFWFLFLNGSNRIAIVLSYKCGKYQCRWGSEDSTITMFCCDELFARVGSKFYHNTNIKLTCRFHVNIYEFRNKSWFEIVKSELHRV